MTSLKEFEEVFSPENRASKDAVNRETNDCVNLVCKCDPCKCNPCKCKSCQIVDECLHCRDNTPRCERPPSPGKFRLTGCMGPDPADDSSSNDSSSDSSSDDSTDDESTEENDVTDSEEFVDQDALDVIDEEADTGMQRICVLGLLHVLLAIYPISMIYFTVMNQ